MTHASTIPMVTAVRKRERLQPESQGVRPSPNAHSERACGKLGAAWLTVAVSLAAFPLWLGWTGRGSSPEVGSILLFLLGAAFGIAPLVVGAPLGSAPARASGAAPRILGQYTLEEKIGEGGMGVVYRARHALLERPTAVKLLHPERATLEHMRRFEREVQLTSKLSHPNTISIYDFGKTEEGSFYYAMEYLDGVDLQTLVERDGPQDPARVAHLLAQVCGALSEAHGAGLIHRDIKPANVVVCERGGAQDVVKVLDFGLTKQLENPALSLTHSDAQAIIGTPLYLSPEALAAPDTMDGRSDLYAVGALGYFLLTGAPPFSGSGLLEVCAHHLHTTPLPPSARRGSRIPSGLEALILACLEKTMARRPPSAAALRSALLPFAAAWSSPASARGSATVRQSALKLSATRPRATPIAGGLEVA